MTEPVSTRPPGFTLLEILVAVFIFAIVMTTLFSSFGSFITTGRALTESVEIQESLRCPMGVMETDLMSVVVRQPPQYKKNQSNAKADEFRMSGEVVSVEGQTFSTLMFASLNHIPPGGSLAAGVARIRYHVRANPDGGYDLCRSDNLRPFPDALSLACDPVLFRNVRGFSVTFFDEDGKDSTHWDSESRETGYAFPVALGLDITIKTYSGEQTIRTRFPLTVGRRVEE